MNLKLKINVYLKNLKETNGNPVFKYKFFLLNTGMSVQELCTGLSYKPTQNINFVKCFNSKS